MVNYQSGKIYKIVDNTTDKIYIGSTCEPTLARRLAKHTSNYKDFINGKSHFITSFEIIKNDNYDIVLLESYPCNSKDELHSRERFYIENNICVNKNIPGRTEKEYQKIYRENNKDTIKEYKKIYQENNKDTLKEYQKIYQENNKDTIKEYKKIYWENNKDTLKEYKKIYQENNKDTIKEYKKIYWEKNKEQFKLKKSEKIICDICNRQYRKDHESRHRKSQVHLNHIEHDED